MNPLRIISLFIIKTAIKFIRIPNPVMIATFNSLFTGLILGSFRMARVNGVIPTVRVLWNLRRVLRNPDLTSFEQVRQVLINNPHVNSSVMNGILTFIVTDLKKCFGLEGVRTPLNKIFTLFFALFTSSISIFTFKPLLYWLTRVSAGVIFTTCGVLWNESLSTITFLKDYALFVKELVENNTHFKLPSGTLSSSLSLCGPRGGRAGNYTATPRSE